ncbi:hypothetical protein ACOMHN_005701 [Nucella lapillus]
MCRSSVPAVEARPPTSCAAAALEASRHCQQLSVAVPFDSSDGSVTSSQQGGAPVETMGGAMGDVAVVKSESVSLADHLQDTTISSWLTGLGLGNYIDVFHQHGYANLYQLEDFSMEALAKLRISVAHRTRIWKSLEEWRESISNTVDLSQLQPSLGTTSDLGLTSPQQQDAASLLSQQSSFCPGLYEITRYSYKQVFTFAPSETDEHVACGF